jgi:DsbC/DsbD-like thiol-disulfide interchange protein
MMSMSFLLLAVCLLLISPQRPADVVKWSAGAPVTPVAAGGEATVSLTAQIENGWKLYALTQAKGGPQGLTIAVAKGAPFAVQTKRIVAPKPKVHTDENFNLDTQYYDTDTVFTVPVVVAKSAAAGSRQVPIDVTFQACGAEICLRPFTEHVTVTVTITK